MILVYSGSKEPNIPQPHPELSLGGYASSSIVGGNLWSDVGRSEILQTPVEYRFIVLRNPSDNIVENIKIYYEVPSGSSHYFEMSLVAPGKDKCCSRNEWERIPDPFFLPTFAEFSDNLDLSDSFEIERMDSGQEVGIWIRRVINVEDFKRTSRDCDPLPLNTKKLMEGTLKVIWD